MKEWVNEQLTAYSTIVSTEAKITALQSEVDGKLAAQKTYLEALVNALSSSVTTDITAIRKQIEEISDKLGFPNTAYFRKIVKRYTGKTPSAIRKEFKHI